MRRPSFASTTRPAASIRSFAASAFVPNSFTTCPFTRTCPLRISSSACRREAIPARAIIFCNLSSMLSLVFSESCSFLCRCGLAPPVFLKQGALIRDRSVSLFLQPNVGRSNYCVNRKVDQPDYQPHDCEACRLRLNIKVGNEKKRTETENYRCDSNPDGHRTPRCGIRFRNSERDRSDCQAQQCKPEDGPPIPGHTIPDSAGQNSSLRTRRLSTFNSSLHAPAAAAF